LQNPSKRFCRFPKVSKCVQSLKKGIKNSTEPFFRFCTAKKGSVRKYETLRVLYKTISVQCRTIRVLLPTVNEFVQNPQGFVFSHGTFFCCTEPKKRFCKRWFCEWVKRRTFKRFRRIFILFLRLWTHL